MKTSIYIGDGVWLEYDDRSLVFKTEHKHTAIYLGNEAAARLLLELSKRFDTKQTNHDETLTD